MLHVLDPRLPEHDRYRVGLYKENGKLSSLMDVIMSDPTGAESPKLLLFLCGCSRGSKVPSVFFFGPIPERTPHNETLLSHLPMPVLI
jgi:hypothetical protein